MFGARARATLLLKKVWNSEVIDIIPENIPVVRNTAV
jgi:hypothetical protein